MATEVAAKIEPENSARFFILEGIKKAFQEKA
jgi:hypothetical protein